MTEKIDSKVFEMIKNNADLENSCEAISPDAQILSLGITSRSFIELVVALESEFNIEFEDENLDVRHFNTVNDLLDFVKKHIAKN
jgi:acyl carrier protein